MTFAPDAVRLIYLWFSVRFFRHCRWLRSTVYVLYCIRATCDSFFGAFGDGPGQSRHGNRTEPLCLPYGGCAEMIRWLCDRRVVLDGQGCIADLFSCSALIVIASAPLWAWVMISVPSSFVFFFHSYEASCWNKRNSWRWPIFTHLENVDPLQCDRTVMVRSPWDCRKITALYPCDFMGTARAPCGNRSIAKSLQSSYDSFWPNWSS